MEILFFVLFLNIIFFENLFVPYYYYNLFLIIGKFEENYYLSIIVCDQET